MNKIKKGDIFDSNNCGKFEIISDKFSIRNNREFGFKIKFLQTGYIREATKSNILLGKVTDVNTPSVCGIGFIGEGKYNSSNYRTIYCKWKALLDRCYNSNNIMYYSYGNSNVTVCEEWFNFQNFAAWYEEYYIEGYELDKDILANIQHLEQKVYSPSTCIFIPKDLNCFLAGDCLFSGIVFRISSKNIYFYIDAPFYKAENKSFENFYEAKKQYAIQKYNNWIKLVESYLFEDYFKQILLKYDFTHFWKIEGIDVNEVFFRNKKEILNIINK